jgi:hypothetical protein
MIKGRSYQDEKEPASDGCLGLTLAEWTALGPLESLPPEPCPPELAARTVRCLCAMAQEAQTCAPTATSEDREGFWLCLSSNILMM